MKTFTLQLQLRFLCYHLSYLTRQFSACLSHFSAFPFRLINRGRDLLSWRKRKCDFMMYWFYSDDLNNLNRPDYPKMISDEILQIKCDWLQDFMLHKQNLLWLRRRLPFRLHNTEWVTALHKSSGIYLACGPSLSKTALLPKKSACSLQRAGCDTDSSSIWSASPERSARKARYIFASQTSWSSGCTQDCLPTLVRMWGFNAAHKVNTIRLKPDVETLVCGTFCPDIADKNDFRGMQMLLPSVINWE